MDKPLADRIRPATLEEVVGQEHLLEKGKVLYNLIQSGKTPNMIFYGPSGVGKTTVANIIAAKTGKKLYKLNATTASVADIKEIIASLDSFLAPDGVLLYLDEIQHFNKKQQQSLLEFMENGKITVIASTTENPYFYIYNALLSRSVVFEFKALTAENILTALQRAVKVLSDTDYASYEIKTEETALRHIAETAGGDVRKALNVLEICFLSARPEKDGTLCLNAETAEQATQKKVMRYDKDGDNHYDILSAFQKSVRGSDPDAAIYYLARLIAADDLQSICRRVLVMAAEDIGLAYPQAIAVVKACVDSALQLGLPEARIPLAEAVLLLATAPKSNSAITAIDAALADIKSKDTGSIPRQLQNKHYDGIGNEIVGQHYLYPHNFPNHYVKQQYLPDNIKDTKYYEYGDNKTERLAMEYWKRIKGDI